MKITLRIPFSLPLERAFELFTYSKESHLLFPDISEIAFAEGSFQDYRKGTKLKCVQSLGSKRIAATIEVIAFAKNRLAAHKIESAVYTTTSLTTFTPTASGTEVRVEMKIRYLSKWRNFVANTSGEFLGRMKRVTRERYQRIQTALEENPAPIRIKLTVLGVPAGRFSLFQVLLLALLTAIGAGIGRLLG